MALDLIAVHFVLAIALFFIINWIGDQSYSMGYFALSIFTKYDEAPAFNFVFRILSPIVFLFVSASILYYFKFDRYIHNFYMVSFYYILIRALINISTGKGSLLNWYRQIAYWSFIMFFSYYSYTNIIVTKKNLLPDFSNLANELWIIIILFIYKIANGIELPHSGTDKRKEDYIKARFTEYSNKYGHIISKLGNDKLVSIAYAIIIYENFNRPLVIRYLENISFLIRRKPHTLGIMQVNTNKIINDEESIMIGIEKIRVDYEHLMENLDGNYEKRYWEDDTEPNWRDGDIITDLVAKYNGGTSYRSEVVEIQSILLDRFFGETTDTLSINLKRYKKGPEENKNI